MNSKNKKNKTFKVSPYIKQIMKLMKPVIRKTKPKSGSLLKPTDLIIPGVEFLDKKKWVKVPEHGITLWRTKAFIDTLQKTKYRYPLDGNFDYPFDYFKKKPKKAK